MSQTFSGTMLLGIILLIIITLFVLGLLIKPKLNQSLHKSAKQLNPRRNKNTTFGMPDRFKTAKSKRADHTKPSKFRSPVGDFKKSNSQLMALKKRVTKLFPELTATVKERHLVLERGAKKVAMLTVDQKAALGRRKLGDVAVINFHDVPSSEELKIELSGV